MYNLHRTKILFTPIPMLSHVITLLSLFCKLDPNYFKSAILLPKHLHFLCKNVKGLICLEFDRQLEDKLKPEMMAIRSYKPDVLVDDLNYYAAFSSRIMEIPRVSIVRKGILPFEIHTNGYTHSSKAIEFLKNVKKIDYSALLDWKPMSLSDLFQGDINIIPSIPSVEVIPEKIKKKKDIYTLVHL